MTGDRERETETERQRGKQRETREIDCTLYLHDLSSLNLRRI